MEEAPVPKKEEVGSRVVVQEKKRKVTVKRETSGSRGNPVLIG
jgi:hypothetical protein